MRIERTQTRHAASYQSEMLRSITDLSVANCDELLHNLKNFTHWQYDKSDLNPWIPVLNRFDDVLATADVSDELLLHVLRVTGIILENCTSRQIYNSVEHLVRLLASCNWDVLIGVLSVIYYLVGRIGLHKNTAAHGRADLSQKLFYLSQGFGRPSDSLSMLRYIKDDTNNTLPASGGHLHFEYTPDAETGEGRQTTARTALVVLEVEDVYKLDSPADKITDDLIQQHSISKEMRFPLLCRVRLAKTFRTVEARHKAVWVRLYALACFLPCHPDARLLTAYFQSEPDIVQEVLELLRHPGEVPEDIEVLALHVLTSFAHDGSRHLSLVPSLGADVHHGLFSSLLRQLESNRAPSWVEALLALVASIVHGTTAASSAGIHASILTAILGLLQDHNPSRLNANILGLKILEALVTNGSNSVVTIMRDSSGFQKLTERFTIEVNRTASLEPSGELYTRRSLIRGLMRPMSVDIHTHELTNIRRVMEGPLPDAMKTIFSRVPTFGATIYYHATSLLADLLNEDPTCIPTQCETGLIPGFLDSLFRELPPATDALVALVSALSAICLHQTGLAMVIQRDPLPAILNLFTAPTHLRSLRDDTPTLMGTAVEELLRLYPTLKPQGIAACSMLLSRLLELGYTLPAPAIGTPTVSAAASTAVTSSSAAAVPSASAPAPSSVDTNGAPADSQTAPATTSATVSTGTAGPVGSSTSVPPHHTPHYLFTEYVNRTARFLEPLFGNGELGKLFVTANENLNSLLSIFSLSNLPHNFSRSSASHALMLALRNLAQQPGVNMQPALVTLLHAQIKNLEEVTGPLSSCESFESIKQSELPAVLRSLQSVETYVQLLTYISRNSPSQLSLPEIGEALKRLARLDRLLHLEQARVSLTLSAQVDLGAESTSAQQRAQVETRESRAESDSASQPHSDHEVDHGESRNEAGSEEAQEDDEDEDEEEQEAGGEGREEMFHYLHEESMELEAEGEDVPPLIPTEEETIIRLQRIVDANVSATAATPSAPPSSVVSREVILSQCSAALRSLLTLVSRVICYPPSRSRRDMRNAQQSAQNSAQLEMGMAQSQTIATYLAGILKELLVDWDKPVVNGSVQQHCLYVNSVVKEMKKVLLDERHGTANVLCLQTFYRVGCLQQLMSGVKFWAKCYVNLTDNDPDKTMVENSLSVLGGLLASLVSPQYILRSPLPTLAASSLWNPKTLFRSLLSTVLGHLMSLFSDVKISSLPSAFLGSVLTLFLASFANHEPPTMQSRAAPAPRFDEATITALVEMGFPRNRAEAALQHVGADSVELAMDWLLAHPEDMDIGGAARANRNAATAADSETATGPSTEELQQLIRAAEETATQAVSSLAGSEAVSVQVSDEEWDSSMSGWLRPMTSYALTIAQHAPTTAIQVGECLIRMSQRKNGDLQNRIAEDLLQQVFVATEPNLVGPLTHVLAFLLHKDPSWRILILRGHYELIPHLVSRLEDWLQTQLPSYQRPSTHRQFSNSDLDEATARQLKELTQPESTQKPHQFDKSSVSETPGWVSSILVALEALTFTSPAATVAQPPPSPSHHSPMANLTPQLPMEERRRCLEVCIMLLRIPLSASTVQAVLQLSVRLTKDPELATLFLEGEGLVHTLRQPATGKFEGAIKVITVLCRHLVEDAKTLQLAMESDLRTLLAGYRIMTTKDLLKAAAPLIAREPTVFMAASAAVLNMKQAEGRWIVELKPESTESSSSGPAPSAATTASSYRTSNDLKTEPNQKQVDLVLEALLEFLDESIESSNQPEYLVQPEHVIHVLAELISSYPSLISKLTSFSSPALRGDSFVTFLIKSCLKSQTKSAVASTATREASPAGSNSSLNRGLPSGGMTPMIGAEPTPESQAGLFPFSMRLLGIISSKPIPELRRDLLAQMAAMLVQSTKIPDDKYSGVRITGHFLYMLLQQVESERLNQSSSQVASELLSAEQCTNLLATLSEALESIDLDSKDAGDALIAVLKPFEIVSRVAHSHSTVRIGNRRQSASMYRSMPEPAGIRAARRGPGGHAGELDDDSSDSSESEGDNGDGLDDDEDDDEDELIDEERDGRTVNLILDSQAHIPQMLMPNVRAALRRAAPRISNAFGAGGQVVVLPSMAGMTSDFSLEHLIRAAPAFLQMDDATVNGNLRHDVEATPGEHPMLQAATGTGSTAHNGRPGRMGTASHAFAVRSGDDMWSGFGGDLMNPGTTFRFGSSESQAFGFGNRRSIAGSRWNEITAPREDDVGSSASNLSVLEERLIQTVPHTGSATGSSRRDKRSVELGGMTRVSTREEDHKTEEMAEEEDKEEEEEEEATSQTSSSDNQQTPAQPSPDPMLSAPQTQAQEPPTPAPEAVAEPLPTLPLPAVEVPVPPSDATAPRVESTPPRSAPAEPTEGESEADMNAMLQMAGIDVDFINALPEDIRAEILSQQMGSLGLNRPPRSRPSGSVTRVTPSTPARAAPESSAESTPSVFSTPTVSAAPTVAPGAPRIAPADPMTFNLGSELNLFSNLVAPGAASSNQSQSVESMSDSAFMSSIESALAAALSAVSPAQSTTAAAASAASSAPGSTSNQVSNSASASSSTPTVSSRSNDLVTDSEGISQEFLDALPPDIRAEVLAQERLLNGRNASATAASASPSVSAHAQDMDNASFIATLSPELREEVLMTSSDEFLASLPPELVAEAMLMRERMMQQYSRRMPRVGQLGAQLGAPVQMTPVSAAPRAEAVAAVAEREQEEANVSPILQENTVLMLIRLLYLATPVSRTLYHRVMLSLCANPTTRRQLLQFVLKVLHNKSVNQTLDQKTVQHESTTSSGASVEVQSIQRDDRIPPPSLYGGQHVNSCPGGTSSADLVYSVSSSRAVDLLSSLARSNHRTVNWFLLPRDTQSDSSPVQTEPRMESPSDCRLSELLSLLRLPLFRSSSTHLDSLINLLSLLVHPLLSTAAMAARSEPAARVPAEPAASSSTSSSTSSSAEAAATPASTPAPPTLPVQQVESQSRLGEVSPAAMRPLCEVLSLPTASEATVEKATEILVCLAAQSNNRKFLLHELSGLLTGLVEDVNTHLRRFLSADVSVEGNEKESLADSWSLSSSEIKLLRVLKTIKQLAKESTEVAAAVLHTTTSLPRLWEVLSLCLSGLTAGVSEGSNAVPPVLARLLPVIEAFFIVHGFVDQTPPTPAPTTPSNSNIDNSSAFVRFCETHRKILNIFIRQNPNLLQQTFEPLTKIPRILEFDNKRSYFRSQLRARRGERHFDSIRLQVRRDNVFMDSFYQLRIRTAEEMKGRLGVQFQGEEGIDAGGLTREWFMILSRQIFNPDYALFRTAANGTTFQPNQFSHVNPEHLSFFKFVGRIIGKALYDGYMLDAYFTRSFYKHMLGIAVTYHDMEAIDPEYYKNLKWTLENDITDVVDITFSVETEELGRQIVVDLKPNGRNIPVTESNKMEYVQLLCELKMTTAIKQQIDSFLEGFRELIPADLISLFDDRELELLISGLPDIDVEDLRNNTEYSNFTVDSPQIRWFWDVLRSYDQQDRAAFLQFVTGTSRVPLEGFKALQGMRGPQKFQIHKAFGSTDRLPSAHTCFNQLDLPDYETATQLKERLTFAIREGYVGFGFG